MSLTTDKKSSKRPTSGFTIVELLIVIVVIAILAAITIVAYAGIQTRSQASADQAALHQVNQKLAVYAVDNGTYPTDLATAGINDGATTYQYTYSNTSPISYCVTATTGSTSQYISTTSGVPTSGACAGHGSGGIAPITNLVVNSSSETTVLSINSSDATATRTTSAFHSGLSSTMLVKSSTYAFVKSAGSLGVAGDIVTFSAWVKSSVTTIRFIQRGSGVAYASSTKPITANTWTRISQTYTVPSGATSFQIDIGWEGSDYSSGTTAYIDDLMATSGTTLYTFADGSSAGWVWNGAANGSTSVGPPL